MIQGSIVALVTPMFENGDVDKDSLKKLVEYHIEQGTDALVAVGTTGESATLDEDEHCDVIKFIVEITDRRIPVIAGTGANSTKEAITLTQKAKALGVDACLIVTPYYNKPTQEGLYLHHKAIAEAVDIPQILYNLLGGNGTITVTGNVAPRLVHDMILAAMSGDKEIALALDNKLAALHSHLFIQSNPIPVKWAVAEMGLIGVGIRLPLTWLTADCFDLVRDALRQAEVI